MFKKLLHMFLTVGMLLGMLIFAPSQRVAALGTNRYVARTGTDFGNTCWNIASPCLTIANAILQSGAATSDVIHIAAGTYSEHLIIDKSITLAGAGVNATIIDGTLSGSVIVVQSGKNLTISDLTIQNGNNPAGYGGGISNTLGHLVLNRVKIINNKSGYGSGINNDNGNMDLNDVEISGNSATSNGGGIMNSAGNAYLTNVTLSGNSAGSDGGGINHQVSGTVSLTNVTISNNTAHHAGALIVNGSSIINITNSTIAFNHIDAYPLASIGGIVRSFSGVAINMANSIVYQNDDRDCNNVPVPIVISLGNNIDGDSTCLPFGIPLPSDHPSTNPLLGALANHGGYVATHGLLLGSPAIDAGNDGYCPLTDANGRTRSQDGNNDGIVHCDIGAFEHVSTIVSTDIGGLLKGSYILAASESMRVNYAGVDGGPVKVSSTNNVPIIAAIRDAWAVNGVTTSFFQLMGLPLSQLSDTYIFSAYNNVTLNEQLRIGNVDIVPSTVEVTIGGLWQGAYVLQPNQTVRINYAGLDSGPVVVQGSPGVKIISAIREAWVVNGVTTSFTQLMGLPYEQLSDTYVFPGYNNVTLNEQLRIGNVDTVPSTVTVTIGGVVRGTYTLAAHAAMRINYAGLDSGPVVVAGTSGVKIISAIRDAWAVNGVTTSFSQLTGLPSGQVSNKYIFPAYNNVTLNDQLRIGNVDNVPSTVTVTIGGIVRGIYTLQPNEAVRVNYAGLDSGPVVVQGTTGVNIISAIREAWAVNGVTQSFVQLMGLPSGQLSSTFWFPAYNNVTLNEQLRIAVP